MWHYVISTIWRNLLRDIKIDINQTSEELLKLVRDQKIFIFRGGGGLPYEEEVRKFSHSVDTYPMRGKGIIF